MNQRQLKESLTASQTEAKELPRPTESVFPLPVSAMVNGYIGAGLSPQVMTIAWTNPKHSI